MWWRFESRVRPERISSPITSMAALGLAGRVMGILLTRVASGIDPRRRPRKCRHDPARREWCCLVIRAMFHYLWRETGLTETLVDDNFRGRMTRDGIRIHEPADFDGMHRAGRLAAEILDAMIPHVAPGQTTEELDRLITTMVGDAGARSATIGYRGY